MRNRNSASALARTLLGSLVVVAVTACGGTQRASKSSDSAAASVRPSSPSASGSPSAEPLPSTRATASGTAAQRAAAQAALAAYNGMWEDLTELGRTSDYKNPRMGAHMLYQPLTDWTQQFEDAAGRGIVSRGLPVWHPRVVSVTPADKPTRVEIADCVDASHWLKYYATSGKLVDNVAGGRHRTKAAVTFDRVWERWLVTQQVFGVEGTC